MIDRILVAAASCGSIVGSAIQVSSDGSAEVVHIVESICFVVIALSTAGAIIAIVGIIKDNKLCKSLPQ